MSKLIADEALRSKLKAMSASDIHRAILIAYEEEIADLLAAAQRQLLTELLEQLPRPVKNWDESFCITCEAFLEDDNYQCYCDLRNELLDQVVSIIEHYLTKVEPEQGEKG